MDAEGVGDACGKWYADKVVDECPEEVLTNHRDGASAKTYRLGQAAQVVAHECDLGYVHCHIGAATHSYAQCR